MDQKRYLVILADRQKAKFFTLFLGTVEEKGEITDKAVPQKVKAAHTRTDHVNQHIRNHLHYHLKLVGQKLKEFAISKKIDVVLIGGHKELFNQVKKHLPYQLRDKIRGEFVSELNIPTEQIAEKSKLVIKNLQIA